MGVDSLNLNPSFTSIFFDFHPKNKASASFYEVLELPQFIILELVSKEAQKIKEHPRYWQSLVERKFNRILPGVESYGDFRHIQEVFCWIKSHYLAFGFPNKKINEPRSYYFLPIPKDHPPYEIKKNILTTYFPKSQFALQQKKSQFKHEDLLDKKLLFESYKIEENLSAHSFLTQEGSFLPTLKKWDLIRANLQKEEVAKSKILKVIPAYKDNGFRFLPRDGKLNKTPFEDTYDTYFVITENGNHFRFSWEWNRDWTQQVWKVDTIGKDRFSEEKIVDGIFARVEDPRFFSKGYFFLISENGSLYYSENSLYKTTKTSLKNVVQIYAIRPDGGEDSEITLLFKDGSCRKTKRGYDLIEEKELIEVEAGETIFLHSFTDGQEAFLVDYNIKTGDSDFFKQFRNGLS